MRATSATISLVAVATLGAIVIAGCAGGALPAASRRTSLPTLAPASAGSGSDTAPAPPTAAITSVDDNATVMQVTLGSGPDSGSHDAYSSSITCTYGLAAPGDAADDSFGNQFADDSSAGLSAVELIVPATRSAADMGTESFLLSVTIGKPSKGHRYEINTLPADYGLGRAQGDGTLTIDDHQNWGVVNVRGKVGDGTAMEAVIRCNRILDADGQPRE